MFEQNFLRHNDLPQIYKIILKKTKNSVLCWKVKQVRSYLQLVVMLIQ